MTKKITILSMVFAFLAVIPIAVADPYDLRGVRLGITLQEFKSIPYPDEKSKNIKIVCSNEAAFQSLSTYSPWGNITLKPQGTDAKIGLLKCVYMRGEEQAAMNVGGKLAATFYSFVPDESETHELRLFQITVRVGSCCWTPVMDAYREKFGAPVPFQGSLVWMNGESIIATLRALNGTGTVNYTHDALTDVYLKRKEAIDGKPSDKL